MCGLVGMFGDISLKMEGVFEDLLHMDVIRGPHSTGVAILWNEDKTPKIIKDTVSPAELLARKDYQKAIVGKRNILMMGHNRFATKGKVTKKNAHPFRVGNVTLVHNGTLWSTHILDVDKKYDTDSETICASIEKNGIADTWKNVDGAAMLVWWDRKSKTLNFINNGKRPFHFNRTKDKKSLIWASEQWMLQGACRRKNIQFDGDKVYKLPNDSLFTFKVDENGIVRYEVTKLDKFTWVGRTYNNFIPHNYFFSESDHGSHMRKKDKRDLENAQRVRNQYREGRQSLIPFDSISKDYSICDDKNLAVNQMTLAKFRGRYDKCIFCEDILVDLAQYEVAVVIDDYSVVCGSCSMVAEMNNINITKEMLLK